MKTKTLLLFALILLSLNLVLAEYDWDNFGKSTLIRNSQVPTPNSVFNAGVYNLSTSISMNLSTNARLINYQPLSTNFQLTDTDPEYLIFPNYNYIEVLDKNLGLIQEVNSGTVLSQLGLVDFFGTGHPTDIVGVFGANATTVSFRVFSFNYTSLTFNKSYEANFTVANSSTIAGIKTINRNSIFVLNTGTNTYSFVNINNSASSEVAIAGDTTPYVDPPIAWDFNNDGLTEYLVYTRDKVLIFDSNGNTVTNITATGGHVNNFIQSVKVFKPDNSNVYKIALVETINTGLSLQVRAIKPDGSSYWSLTPTINGNGISVPIGSLAVISNYAGAGDTNEDLYLVAFEGNNTASFQRVYAITGSTGNVFKSEALDKRLNWTNPSSTFQLASLTTANLNPDVYPEFIYARNQMYFIFNLQDNITYVNQNASGNNYYSCIPTDINVDSFQEVVCAGNKGVNLYYSNYINQDSTLVSVSFSPSTFVQINSPLTVYVTATDIENDQLQYNYQCSATTNFTGYSSTNSYSCSYSSAGIYNLTILQKDIYQATPTMFSQLITVSTTGAICNNNGTCDSYLGETNSNCPNDCTTTQSGSTFQTANGTATIPTQLVDTTNIQQGLLPEIYYGMLGFFSYILIPLIILVFFIFFVLIILAFGTIIKNIAHRVTG
jgi:hypothetical protein